MSAIPVRAFLHGVQRIADAKPTYMLGTDGSRGACDCIGLIIGAVRRAGGVWNGRHGSNWAARNAIIDLQSPAPLELGCIVFKAHDPGVKANTLPDTYKDHPDQRDYYHAGVVTGVSPLRITHCTGGTTNGIKVDTTIGAWRFGGRLEGLEHVNQVEGKMEPTETAVVYAASGETVRMRMGPSDRSAVCAKVPVGETVEVKTDQAGWKQISYEGRVGWMMAEFLKEPAKEPLKEPEDGEPRGITLTLPNSAAKALFDALKQAMPSEP